MKRKPKSILTVDTDITEKNNWKRNLRAQRLESIGTRQWQVRPEQCTGTDSDQLNCCRKTFRSIESAVAYRTGSQRQTWGYLVKQVLGFARGMKGESARFFVRHLLKEIAKRYFPNPSKSIQTYRQTFGLSVQMQLNCIRCWWTSALTLAMLCQMAVLWVFVPKTFSLIKTMPESWCPGVGPFIVITVSDTGTGIPPEIVDRILSHFYNQRVGPRYGSFFHSNWHYQSHGGFVNVTSQVEKGTQFQVYLPAVEGTETQAEDLELPTGHGELIPLSMTNSSFVKLPNHAGNL